MKFIQKSLTSIQDTSPQSKFFKHFSVRSNPLRGRINKHETRKVSLPSLTLILKKEAGVNSELAPSKSQIRHRRRLFEVKRLFPSLGSRFEFQIPGSWVFLLGVKVLSK